MANASVTGDYRLDEATRLSLLYSLPPGPPHLAGWLDQELTALEAAQIAHPEICAGTPRSAMRRILDRDAAALFASGDLGRAF